MDKHPFEVLERIVAELDRPRDLLALALTNRVFPDIIIPHYIEFCDIRCDPHRTTLWNSLADRPHLAARIRRLELIPEYERVTEQRLLNIRPRKPIIPSQFADKPLDKSELSEADGKKTDECFLALAAAVKQMCGLVRFRWERNDTCPPTLGDVFGSLIKSGAPIKELGADLFDSYNSRNTWRRQRFGNFINDIWEFSNLTKVSVEVNQTGGPIIQYAQKLTQMLIIKCPSIQELNINFWDRPAFDTLIEDGYWPMLTRLTIGERSIPHYNNPSHAKMYSIRMRHFFERHNNIECLWLKGNDALWPGALQDGMLPRLKYLCLPGRYTSRLSEVLPLSVAKRLSHLLAPMDAGCESLLSEMRMLRSYVGPIQQDFDPAFIKHEHLPNLERLCVVVSDIGPFVNSILGLSNLTHFEGAHEEIDMCSLKGLSLLEQLAVLPKLTFIKVAIRGKFRWITLKRDQAGRYTGVWHATRKSDDVRDEYGLRSSEWGGYRRSLFD